MPSHPERVRRQYWTECPSCFGVPEGQCYICRGGGEVTCYQAALHKGGHYDAAADAFGVLSGPVPDCGGRQAHTSLDFRVYLDNIKDIFNNDPMLLEALK